MPLASIQQTQQGATSAAAPASIAPTWTASQVGSLLCVVIGTALSGAPTISTPASWTAGTVITQGTALDLRVFYYINNPGGLTTATFNFTNVNGAAWGVYEVLNANTVVPVDPNSIKTGQNAGSAAPSAPAYSNPTIGNELWLGAVATITGQAWTAANVSDRLAWTTGPTGTSTVGATNVQLFCYSQLAGANPAGTGQITGTLAGSVAWAAFELGIISTASGQLAHGQLGTVNVSAGQGYAVGILG